MYFLGVEGGGTKTTAVLADARGDIIRTARKGSGNIAVLDRGSSAHLIRSIIDHLLSGEDVTTIRRATFAFAGAGRRREKETVGEIIKGAGIKNFTVLTDAEMLYLSAFGDEQGILISSGTGSICLIKGSEGHFQQIGGWGYLLGDEGSGFYIGNQAIRAAIQDAEAGKSPSNLTKELLSFYGLRDPRELITVTYSSINPQKLVASCAKLVCEAAQIKEPNAVRIVNVAATALLSLALKAKEILNSQALHKVALTGSILNDSSIVNQIFKQMAEQLDLRFEYVRPELQPAAAGVLYSLRESGIVVTESLRHRLKKLTFAV